jgi:hypothetical protein
MTPMRVRLLHRLIGIDRAVSAIIEQNCCQTKDLVEHANHQLADWIAYTDEKIAELQYCLARQLATLAPGSAQMVVCNPDHAQSGPPDRPQMLDRLARHLESNRHLGWHDLEALEGLSKKGVFVVGNARSGTTVVQRCLNLSKDVYLLDESNVYVNHSKPEFCSWFNQHHEQSDNIPAKGTFIPTPPIPIRGGLAYLAWLARNYRYVGEKHAFGPHGSFNGVPFQEVFFQFQSRFFFPATYFLVFRKPAECVWSMHKMFPNATIESLIESWLRSANLCIDLYAAFPNCHMLFFQDLTKETISRMSQILQTEIPMPPEMLSDRFVRSSLAAGEIPPRLRAFRDPLDQCLEVYQQLRDGFSPHTLLYHGSGGLRTFAALLKEKIAEILDAIVSLPRHPKHRAAG